MDEVKAKVSELSEKACEISSMFCIVTTAVRDNDPASASPEFNRSLPAALELLHREIDSLWTDIDKLDAELNKK